MSANVCNSSDGVDAFCDRPADHLGDHAGLSGLSVVSWPQRASLGPDDLGKWVRIYSLQGRNYPMGEGRVISWTDKPTVTLLHADGTKSSHIASLPHEVITAGRAA